MSKKGSNIYLFSAAQGSEWSVIAATASDARGAEGEDILSYLGLPESERDFVDCSLLEEISTPLAAIGRRDGENTAILVLRSTVFETSICMALEFTFPAAQLLCCLYGRELNGVIASPLSKELVRDLYEAEDAQADLFAASYVMREAIALGDLSYQGRLSGVSSFYDMVSCIENLVGVKVEFSIMDAPFDTNVSGKVFSSGFCICTALAVAIAASVYSSDGSVRISAFYENGDVTLDISYAEAKRSVWRGDGILARIADIYGIPLDIREVDGRTRCLVIPEYADDALKGLKENILFARTFSCSFGDPE